MALANLLEHRPFPPDPIEGTRYLWPPAQAQEQSLGRVLAIAVLTLDDAIENEWLQRWAAALMKCFPHRWRELAATAGDGMRKLLASGEDMQEATFLCANGLLSRRNVTAAQLDNMGWRLVTFAIEPLEKIGQSSSCKCDHGHRVEHTSVRGEAASEAGTGQVI